MVWVDHQLRKPATLIRSKRRLRVVQPDHRTKASECFERADQRLKRRLIVDMRACGGQKAGVPKLCGVVVELNAEIDVVVDSVTSSGLFSAQWIFS